MDLPNELEAIEKRHRADLSAMRQALDRAKRELDAQADAVSRAQADRDAMRAVVEAARELREADRSCVGRTKGAVSMSEWHAAQRRVREAGEALDAALARVGKLTGSAA